jgi:phosphatidylethanolamine/phosphatidyl-N-methylethanolamine N-methyltransferase
MEIASIRSAYRRYARIYDATFGAMFAPGRARLMGLINRRGGARVLEVGVGTGLSLPKYRPDMRIVGIDVSPEMLDVARRRVARENLTQVEALLEMDAEKLSFDDASFDVVVAMYVMTVVPDSEQVMAELKRVCKPGGTIYVLNHFVDEKEGLLQSAEKMLARLSDNIGWNPDFPIDRLIDSAGIELTALHVVPPFRLFRLLCFRNLPTPHPGMGWRARFMPARPLPREAGALRARLGFKRDQG